MTDEEISEELGEYNGFLEQKREKRKMNVQAKQMSFEQNKAGIHARNGTGEFHDENFVEGQSGEGSQKGKQ